MKGDRAHASYSRGPDARLYSQPPRHRRPVRCRHADINAARSSTGPRPGGISRRCWLHLASRMADPNRCRLQPHPRPRTAGLRIWAQIGPRTVVTFNPGVVGSNPTGPSTLLPYLMQVAKVAVSLTPEYQSGSPVSRRRPRLRRPLVVLSLLTAHSLDILPARVIMPSSVINGVELHFDDTGSGQPLVLVHGSWTDRRPCPPAAFGGGRLTVRAVGARAARRRALDSQ